MFVIVHMYFYVYMHIYRKIKSNVEIIMSFK